MKFPQWRCLKLRSWTSQQLSIHHQVYHQLHWKVIQSWTQLFHDPQYRDPILHPISKQPNKIHVRIHQVNTKYWIHKSHQTQVYAQRKISKALSLIIWQCESMLKVNLKAQMNYYTKDIQEDYIVLNNLIQEKLFNGIQGMLEHSRRAIKNMKVISVYFLQT